MNQSGHKLFAIGPYELLARIAVANQDKDQLDSRALVTVFTVTGQKHVGVPTQYVQTSRSGEFVVMSVRGSATKTLLALGQIVGLEVEDPAHLESFFDKPWLPETGYKTVSKLQAHREVEANWKDFGIACKVDFESFPATDEAPSFVLAWTERLKAELTKIRTEFGAASLDAIKTVNVKYNAGEMTVVKGADALNFTIDLSAGAMDRTALVARLNDAL